MYLRKSRADAQAEARGEGETLARHHRILTELAQRRCLTVTAEYREIVSGDSIAARPQMQAMLADVASEKYAGVLCMEIERLARGNTMDQGIVAQTFKQSGTLIVTPLKTYDPDNEFDEEYFEFSLFMSRREYKTIKRRMQAGRLAAVREGNYLSPVAPYGYRRVSPSPKLHTLEIVPEEAEAVRMIYALYLEGNGTGTIAQALNTAGFLPRKSVCWERASVRKILGNPVYAGLLQWHTKGSGDTCYPGQQPAIITEAVFQAVQEKRHSNPAAQVTAEKRLCNYYHNLLYCAGCGRQMKRRRITGSSRTYLLCGNRKCSGKTVSAAMELVDEAVLAALHYRVMELSLCWEAEEKTAVSTGRERKNPEAALKRIKKQKTRLYELLEQEIYDTETFQERMRSLVLQERALEEWAALAEAEDVLKAKKNTSRTVTLHEVAECFAENRTAEKSGLLHTAIRSIRYHKTERGRRNRNETDLRLEIDFR
jgi:DNA invertase Pin-like site-specific DNA recombinase